MGAVVAGQKAAKAKAHKKTARSSPCPKLSTPTRP